jgi:EAL domain-containing protein (putative c-di-GMP-specific phosphodiesterase class I)
MFLDCDALMLEYDFGVDHPSVVGHTESGSASLEADLARGLREGQFTLHYQPICSSRNGCVLGIEALCRWGNARNGPLSPAAFIPVCERTGLIHDLGRWALHAACAQLAQWDREGLVFPFMSVNVSPKQLQNPAFVRYVDEALAASQIDGSRIELEITEGLPVHDTDQVTKIFKALRSLGIRMAIDDFGTGYSSLTYLQALPFSKLKIDRTFVANLPSSRNDVAIVTALVGLARSLDLALVAEGVETQAQRALLQEMGCDQIQGWLMSKALPADELARCFASQALRMQSFDAQENGTGRARAPTRPSAGVRSVGLSCAVFAHCRRHRLPDTVHRSKTHKPEQGTHIRIRSPLQQLAPCVRVAQQAWPHLTRFEVDRLERGLHDIRQRPVAHRIVFGRREQQRVRLY